MQDITRKAVRPSDSEKHVKLRSIQEDEYIIFGFHRVQIVILLREYTLTTELACDIIGIIPCLNWPDYYVIR